MPIYCPDNITNAWIKSKLTFRESVVSTQKHPWNLRLQKSNRIMRICGQNRTVLWISPFEFPFMLQDWCEKGLTTVLLLHLSCDKILKSHDVAPNFGDSCSQLPHVCNGFHYKAVPKYNPGSWFLPECRPTTPRERLVIFSSRKRSPFLLNVLCRGARWTFIKKLKKS